MSSVHLSDQALVALVSRGDRDALAELYDRYSAAAYGLAKRVVRDSTHAEDVVQDAFLAVWREARRFDARRARPSTWILSLVHHKAVDLVRRESIRSGPPLDDQPERAGIDDVPRDAWLSLQREQVASALAELTDPQREVIELAYFAGYTQSELSDRLGQPIGTIKSRTHAALARLQEALSARGITTENPWSTQSSGT